MGDIYKERIPFNNNIRCIEILNKQVDVVPDLQFNNNIRCIEMKCLRCVAVNVVV